MSAVAIEPVRQAHSGMQEFLDECPEVNVSEQEYIRLLGYPLQFELADRARELADWARGWYRQNGRPWIYARHAGKLALANDKVMIDGVEFSSKALRKQFHAAGAAAAVLAAVSAGAECEEKARQLWQEGKPDEYFFLEIYGSAVVEHLLTAAGARFCAWADANNLAVLPHYSPGYPGWPIEDQGALLQLIVGNTSPPGGRIEVMRTGMLRPKKSQLAVFGLTRHLNRVGNLAELVPCENCCLPACQYRRAEYKSARRRLEDVGRLQFRD